MLATLLKRLPMIGKRRTTEQKTALLMTDIERRPTPEQVMKAVDRLARLETKIQQRTERHHQRDLARAKIIAEREAAERHPAIVRPAVQWELPERWDADDVALNH